MADMLCVSCQAVGAPKRITRGSVIVELGLWILFCAPGIIYSLWRVSSRYNGCRVCGSESMIPVGSPAAQKLLG